jgi:hypothetical protein
VTFRARMPSRPGDAVTHAVPAGRNAIRRRPHSSSRRAPKTRCHPATCPPCALDAAAAGAAAPPLFDPGSASDDARPPGPVRCVTAFGPADRSCANRGSCNGFLLTAGAASSHGPLKAPAAAKPVQLGFSSRTSAIRSARCVERALQAQGASARRSAAPRAAVPPGARSSPCPRAPRRRGSRPA